MQNNFIIAIDGPSGSGKSTTAKKLAEKLSLLYIDTGAMYRAVTLLAIKNGSIDDTTEIISLAENTDIELKFIEGRTQLKADGKDFTEDIRMPDINKKVSEVSKIEGVRKALVKKQQQMGQTKPAVVLEGRDITTVVFPEADVKIYLTASIEKRAERRLKEYQEKNVNITIDEVKENLLERDRIDSGRDISPLRKSEDAIEIDTTDITIDEQVDMIIEIARQRAKEKGIDFLQS